MIPRTATPAPTDRSMWRRLLSRVHPDRGGDGELFVWARELQERVAGGTVPPGCGACADRGGRRKTDPKRADDPPRVPFGPGVGFAALTGRAIQHGSEFAAVLALLRDCWPRPHLAHEQERGASYRRLAAIGHAWGMAKAERVRWYRVAEEIPLSDRHAGHILDRSKRSAA